MEIKANEYTPEELIKIIREWTELNRTEFGKSISRSQGAIKKYESGERDYTFKTFMTICKKHNIEITLTKKKHK